MVEDIRKELAAYIIAEIERTGSNRINSGRIAKDLGVTSHKVGHSLRAMQKGTYGIIPEKAKSQRPIWIVDVL